jgi:hypothetical protein
MDPLDDPLANGDVPGGDGYFSEDMNVDVGTFSLDSLDVGGDTDKSPEVSDEEEEKTEVDEKTE